MSTKLFINTFISLFNQSRGGSVVRGDAHTLFLTNYYKKCPSLCKMVQIVIKVYNLVESCTMAYQPILEE